MPDISFPYLGIEFQHVSKTVFNLFGIEVKWYGVIIVFGIIMGLYTATREAKRTGQNPDIYYDYLNYALIAAIIGARLYYVIFTWEDFKGKLFDIINIRSGGLAIYGGIIAAVITAIVFTKIKKINLLLFLDTAAPSLALGQAIGRWGNFVNREAFGNSTDSLFAIRYLKSQIDSYVPDSMIRIAENGVEYIQVHPTFLYESLWSFALFFILVYLRPKKKFDGQITALYFFGYGIGRAWIEGMRTDQLQILNTGIAASQILSILLAAMALAFLIYKSTKLKKAK